MLKIFPIASLLALLLGSNCLIVTRAQTRVRDNGHLAEGRALEPRRGRYLHCFV
jgi:hypothetical protein